MIYLLGDQDNDPEDLSSTCRSNLQGSNRYERGLIYYNHIIDVFGQGIDHQAVVVPGVGHDNREMYASSQGLAHLFDLKPQSSCMDLSTSTSEPTELQYVLMPNPATDFISIHLDLPKNPAVQITIWGIDGKIHEISKKNTSSGVVIDIRDLPRGLYFVQVMTGYHKMTKSFIKI